MCKKIEEVLRTSIEVSELITDFDSDFQNIVNPFISKDNAKKRIVMFPIQDKPFAVIFCVVSPKLQESVIGAIINECSVFTWPTMKKTILLEYECTMKQKCQMLLRVTRRLFAQVASLETLLRIAMDQAKQLTKAEHCTVMLIDVDRMDLYDSGVMGGKERRFPLNVGITGEVIRTGTLINMQNTNDHHAFNPVIDSLPGVECRNLLCFPIREQSGIIGVGHLINKITDPYFDAMDEEMALAFSIYCGVCIMHSVVYQKIQEAHIRNALANELVMYHMKVDDQEVVKMLECTGFHNHPHLSSLHFNPRAIPLRELPCYVLKMMYDLGFDKKFNLKKLKLARYILYVKKGYRDVPYHNWTHAFNVAQWAFAAIVNYKLIANGIFSELQAMMYILAGLMHDLDHRGTTNSFQIQGQTTLAALYSSEGSVMERHHLAQAMCILNTEGCDILESLPRRDYDRALLLLRDFILATDLANYFKNQSEYKAIAADFQKGNKLHVNALSCMLMNCADLSDTLKDWGSVKKTAASVLTEFFKQGDVEKSRGELPALMMDREKCFIPDLEIQFLSSICMPLFEIVGRILPRAAPCSKIIENHMERWDAARPVFAEVPAAAGLSVLLSPELDNLIEQNLREKELEKERLEQERLEAEAQEKE
ncbi:cGMP-dependent 3',5'-cyclic phosphodiesterase-like isoform X2 [Anticarsia gemmatalis]